MDDYLYVFILMKKFLFSVNLYVFIPMMLFLWLKIVINFQNGYTGEWLKVFCLRLYEVAIECCKTHYLEKCLTGFG